MQTSATIDDSKNKPHPWLFTTEYYQIGIQKSLWENGEIESCKFMTAEIAGHNLVPVFANYIDLKDAERAVNTLNWFRVKPKPQSPQFTSASVWFDKWYKTYHFTLTPVKE